MTYTCHETRRGRRPVDPCFAVALTALLTASCATLLGIETPEIALASLQLEEITLTETTFGVGVRITNTNSEPLVVDGATFKLVLDGFKIGTGVTNQVIEIQRLDSAVIRAELFVNHLDMVRRVRKVVDSREFSYALKGKLYVQHGASTYRIPVAQKGSLDIGETFNLGGFDELDRFDGLDQGGELDPDDVSPE
jgi:LEA14-like dessication related protein